MPSSRFVLSAMPVLATAAVWLWSAGPAAAQSIEFNRDIRPILSDKCFACHGPDNNLRKADLRLDNAQGIYEDRGGYKIIEPGQPAKSELYVRITTTEPAMHMPPAKSNKHLTGKEIALLKTWIEQGGKYEGHWAFLLPQRRALPEVQKNDWVRNPIDRFILARLEQEGLQPAEKADRRTLIRRLSFDLTGLPPTPAEVDAFVNDPSLRAYENLVERLLNSPHFGERMATYWLDVVRYADTGGYHSDNHRDLWMYRDYVIASFSKNKRFDQFVTEQLAGDLLPKATREQKVASGFHRLLQTTEEGGAQPKEYSAKYQADRVRNTGSIFLGLTLGCAECHDHKFDPITTKQFYEFAAFFADVQERAVGRQPQTPFPTAEQEKQLAELNTKLAEAQKLLTEKAKNLQAEQAKWEETVKKDKYKGIPANITAILKIDSDKRKDDQKQALDKHYQTVAPQLQAERQQLAALEQQKRTLTAAIPTTLVSMSGPPRTVRVLPRGNWLSDAGAIVQPGVPDVVLPLKTDSKQPSRLDLARWLVDEKNPLTSRVFVNRLWMLFYGQGIVKSLDDFGAQGAWPTHPELLDWLAVEFRDSGWDTRHMIRLMLTSSTYRQTSRTSEELRKRDPYNHLLARQGSWRLEAEMVRDNALSISGLLMRKIGGPSVKPYQPAGYWQHLNFPRRDWVADKDEDQYRRGLYTYWQRTFLHPSLLAFDAPSREECTCERPRSNTPQQALVLLNDPTYVESARVFAEKILRSGGADLDSRIQYAFRQALQRPAQTEEVNLLRKLYEQHLSRYRANGKAAQELLHVGYHPVPQDLPAAELAATTSIARVLLNLHETITRE